MKRSLIIIPTYNEADNILKIVPEVLTQDEGFNVLVVDDNSPDGTAKLVKEMQKNNQKNTRERRDPGTEAYFLAIPTRLCIAAGSDQSIMSW